MLDLSSRNGFDFHMRIMLALALVTVALASGCVRAPAQSVDPNRCGCTLQQQNGGGAYYPYSGR